MEKYYYRAVSPGGRVVEKTVLSQSIDSLRKELEEQSFHIFKIEKKNSFLTLPRLSRKVSNRKMLILYQELLALTKSGLPVIETFQILHDRVDEELLRVALSKIIEHIKGGGSISDALAGHLEIFPELFVSTVRAGESSGSLPEVLKRHIDYQKTILNLRRKIAKALTYPAGILALSTGVVLFLLTYVLPTFSKIYNDMNSKLPYITELLINMVTLGKHFFWLPPVVLLIGTITFMKYYKTERGRLFFDGAFLSLPVMGSIMQSEQLVRISRTLGTILSSGIPLVNAVDIMAESTANRFLRKRLFTVGQKIRGGESVSTAFEALEIIPRISLEMLEVGARTASIVEMLSNLADFHEDELDARLDRITTWIEPVLLLSTGALVAFIVAAIYLPIFNLSTIIR